MVCKHLDIQSLPLHLLVWGNASVFAGETYLALGGLSCLGLLALVGTLANLAALGPTFPLLAGRLVVILILFELVLILFLLFSCIQQRLLVVSHNGVLLLVPRVRVASDLVGLSEVALLAIWAGEERVDLVLVQQLEVLGESPVAVGRETNVTSQRRKRIVSKAWPSTQHCAQNVKGVSSAHLLVSGGEESDGVEVLVLGDRSFFQYSRWHILVVHDLLL